MGCMVQCRDDCQHTTTTVSIVALWMHAMLPEASHTVKDADCSNTVYYRAAYHVRILHAEVLICKA